MIHRQNCSKHSLSPPTSRSDALPDLQSGTKHLPQDVQSKQWQSEKDCEQPLHWPVFLTTTLDDGNVMLIGVGKLILGHLLEDLDAFGVEFGVTLAFGLVNALPVIRLTIFLAVQCDVTSCALEELAIVGLGLEARPAFPCRFPFDVRAFSITCQWT